MSFQPPRRRRAASWAVVAMLGCAAMSACTGPASAGPTPAGVSPPATPSTSTGSIAPQAPEAPSAPPSVASSTPDAPSRETPPPSPSPKPEILASDGIPREARLSIPDLDIEDLPVKPHRGSPDDARGTRIQDGGIAASPYGPDGGVGPGGIGNHIITAHRLSSTQAFLDLPELRDGAKVLLVTGGKRYTYRIVATRKTSFRSDSSLAAQSAPVPGRPGVRATQAMITLSTCRTPEDRAEGNDWSDEFGNPEHRIDKIGELVAIDWV